MTTTVLFSVILEIVYEFPINVIVFPFTVTLCTKCEEFGVTVIVLLLPCVTCDIPGEGSTVPPLLATIIKLYVISSYSTVIAIPGSNSSRES